MCYLDQSLDRRERGIANLTNLNKVKKVHEDLKAAYAALKKVANLSATDKAAEQETINLKISLRKLYPEKHKP